MVRDLTEHTEANRINTIQDYKSRTVKLFVQERDHIIDHHGIMSNNFDAIYDSVSNPDSVYKSGSHDTREVFFKNSPYASYSSRFITKTIVEYDDSNEGFIVTAMPVGKEGGNVGQKLYPEDEL